MVGAKGFEPSTFLVTNSNILFWGYFPPRIRHAPKPQEISCSQSYTDTYNNVLRVCHMPSEEIARNNE